VSADTVRHACAGDSVRSPPGEVVVSDDGQRVRAVWHPTRGRTVTAVFRIATDDGVEIPGDASVGGSFSTDYLFANNAITRTTLSTNQTLSADTATTIAFDAVVTDEPSAFNTSTNTYVVPENGKYHVESAVRLVGSGSAGDDIILSIRINGTEDTTIRFDRGEDFQTTRAISQVVNVSAGDEVDVQITNLDSGDEISASAERDRLTVTKVA